VIPNEDQPERPRCRDTGHHQEKRAHDRHSCDQRANLTEPPRQDHRQQAPEAPSKETADIPPPSVRRADPGPVRYALEKDIESADRGRHQGHGENIPGSRDHPGQIERRVFARPGAGILKAAWLSKPPRHDHHAAQRRHAEKDAFGATVLQAIAERRIYQTCPAAGRLMPAAANVLGGAVAPGSDRRGDGVHQPEAKPDAARIKRQSSEVVHEA